MRILILSCNTGEGHNAAGQAIAEAARRQGHEAEMLDMMLLKGRRTSRLVGGGYVALVKHAPRLFAALYWAGGKLTSPRRKSPVYWANRGMGRRLAAYLREHPADVLVTPHLFPAEAFTYMKRHGLLTHKTIAVSTDYTCIPFWEETECDCYVIPHKDLAEEYARKGIPAEKLYPIGIPVRPAFSVKKSRAEARAACGLPADVPIYLIMGGSMGFGRIHFFVSELRRACKDGEHMVIICGKNRKLYKTLTLGFGGDQRVHILGYTENVWDYMDACDVVFTKPGGLTSTEAAVKNIPMVHTAPIPGCETRNLAFFVERGMSAAGRKMQAQIAAGQALLRPGVRRQDMEAAQAAGTNREAALEIVRLLEDAAEEEAV